MSRQKPRKTKRKISERIRDIKKEAFFKAFSKYGRITKAAEIVGINPDTHYEWEQKDKAYASAFVRAIDAYEDAYLGELHDRIFQGVPEPVVYQGQVMGEWRKVEGESEPRFVPTVLYRKTDATLIFGIKRLDEMRQRRLEREKAQAEAAETKEKSVDQFLIEMYEADQRAAGIWKIAGPDKDSEDGDKE
jgi:hypothetical protein